MKLTNTIKSDIWYSLSAFSIFSLISIMSVGQGLQHRFSDDLPHYYAYVSLAFFFVLLLLTYATARILVDRPCEFRSSGLLGLAMMSVAFIINLYLKSYALHGIPWWLAGFVTIAVAIAAYRRWRSRGAVSVFLVSGSLFLLLLYFTMPPGGDMLLTVEAAGREFIAGKQPYRAYPEIYPEHGFEFSRNLVLTYLPGLWLSYVPAVFFGFDLKFANVVAFLFLIVIFERLLPIQGDRAAKLALLLYPFVFSHLFFFAVINVHTWPYWLLLAGLMTMLLYDRYLIASIFLGLAFATRQSALFIAGPIFAYMLAKSSFTKIILYTLVAAVVFLLICLPFAWNWPYQQGFLQHLFLRFTGMAGDPYSVYKIGAAWYLDYFGIIGWSTWFQIAIIALTMLLVKLLNIIDAARFSLLLGVMVIWLVFLNPYSVPYIYYPGVLLAIIGLVLLPRDEIDIVKSDRIPA
jgi:hypothetical protein